VDSWAEGGGTVEGAEEADRTAEEEAYPEASVVPKPWGQGPSQGMQVEDNQRVASVEGAGATTLVGWEQEAEHFVFVVPIVFLLQVWALVSHPVGSWLSRHHEDYA